MKRKIKLTKYEARQKQALKQLNKAHCALMQAHEFYSTQGFYLGETIEKDTKITIKMIELALETQFGQYWPEVKDHVLGKKKLPKDTSPMKFLA